jgi:DNA-binding NarL/FixJ family response regulator
VSLAPVAPTDRQRLILLYLAEGWDTARIAATLYICPRTVKNDLHRLGFETRAEAVARAIRAGWI